MLYKNIMVAYDGSEPSTEALVVAKDMLGDDPSATIHIVSIIPLGMAGIGVESPVSPITGVSQIFPDMETYEVMMENSRAQTIESVREQLGGMFDDVQCKVTLGAYASAKASTGICDYAKEHDVDMIIMGRRGLGAIRAMMGSVSYAVLHEADIPVVTVK